jgi:hypothetical protein
VYLYMNLKLERVNVLVDQPNYEGYWTGCYVTVLSQHSNRGSGIVGHECRRDSVAATHAQNNRDEDQEK